MNQPFFVRSITLLLCLITSGIFAQQPLDEHEFFNSLKTGGNPPEQLLSTRSVVVHSPSITTKELYDIQKSFQTTGIDAIAYFETDLLFAGRDVAVAYAGYFNRRTIANLVFFQKTERAYSVYITSFNNKASYIDLNQAVWKLEDVSLQELLKKIYRATASSLKNQNFLVIDIPEIDLTVDIIAGRRSEFFPLDLKVDQLAVPEFGDEAMDKNLEEIFSVYPFKYKLTKAGTDDRELRKQGFLYVLCFVHTRVSMAKKILGYDTSKPVSAYASVTYPQGEAQLKNIPINVPVYKFYFKHIDSGNVFFGTKWDADITWQEALRNHIIGFKKELKIN